MNTEGVTDLNDIQCRQATPLQLIKSSESCREILYIQHILLAFFWLDWSKGATFYSSVTEEAIRGSIFGLQLWLSEGDQKNWKVTIFSYILGLKIYIYNCWLFVFSLTSLPRLTGFRYRITSPSPAWSSCSHPRLSHCMEKIMMMIINHLQCENL